MSSRQRKVIRDHAKRAGHLIELWDASDFAWYARHRFGKEKIK